MDEWQSQGREVPHPKSHLIPTIMSSSQAQGGHDGLVAVTTGQRMQRRDGGDKAMACL